MYHFDLSLLESAQGRDANFPRAVVACRRATDYQGHLQEPDKPEPGGMTPSGLSGPGQKSKSGGWSLLKLLTHENCYFESYNHS